MSGSVTYTFSANTKIKSSEVNQNFVDAFPVGAAWTPTIASTGGAVISSPSTNGRYLRHGGLCSFTLDATFSIASATATYISFTLPISTSATIAVFKAFAKDPGEDTTLRPAASYFISSIISNAGVVYRMSNDGVFSMFRPFTIGVLREIFVSGTYEII